MSDFLTELHLNIPLNEGIEGHRAIMREIYRAGCISLHDLSYKTLLPIPVLSKVVNFLIEKEVLSRIPEGILYTEQGMHFIEETLMFYGFGVSDCENCDSLPIFLSPRWNPVLDKLELLFENRPQVDTTLDQAFADPETALLRALYYYKCGALEGKKVAFLGDDDYTSVAIAHLYLSFYPDEPKLIPLEMTIFDIDPRILAGIEEIITPFKFNAHAHLWDYRTKIPVDFIHKFDSIFVDPPYSIEGLKLVLSRAIGLLRQSPGGEVYLSYAHRSAATTHQLQKIILDMGFSIQEIYPRFNYYEGGGILGNTGQMMRLVSTENMQPEVPSENSFENMIYTGEINPKHKIYYCVKCSHMLSLGPMLEMKTIEDLKEKGCPYCKSNGPFHLDEKIETD